MDRTSDESNDPIDPVGKALYEQVLGKSPFDERHPPPLIGLREFTINHLFAKIWSRSTDDKSAQHMSLKERRLVTIALLAAQGRSDQLRDHLIGACRAGLPKLSCRSNDPCRTLRRMGGGYEWAEHGPGRIQVLRTHIGVADVNGGCWRVVYPAR